MESYKRHTQDLNIIIVPESKTCGWGWRQGIAAARAPYIALTSDDLECVSNRWADVCAEVVDEGLLPCPRVYRPDGLIESQGGDMTAVAHLHAHHRKDRAPTDFTTVPFMSAKQAEMIGMVDLQYACDVWVSYRGRQLGYETVLAHGYDLVHHYEMAGRGAGYSQNERNEMDTATMYEELAKHEVLDVR